jgi:undecaprenyl diphosphate synthase
MAGADTAAARYVAIITDGNGRWAHGRGLPVNAGHEAGADTVSSAIPRSTASRRRACATPWTLGSRS